MKLSMRSKNIVAGGIAAVVIVAALAFILGKTTGGSGGGSVSPSTQLTAAATQTSPTQPTKTVTVTVPAGQTVTQTGTVFHESPLKIIDMNASPSIVAAGAKMTFTARVKGDQQAIAYAILMSTDNSTGYTFPIAGSGGQSGDEKKYSFQSTAPAKPGTYRYYVRAIDDTGASIANAENAILIHVK